MHVFQSGAAPSSEYERADGFPVDTEHVVGRPDIGLIFTYGKAETRLGIDVIFVLDRPTCLGEQAVNIFASSLFRGLVGSGHVRGVLLLCWFWMGGSVYIEQKGETHPAASRHPSRERIGAAPLRGGARGWRKSDLGGSGP